MKMSWSETNQTKISIINEWFCGDVNPCFSYSKTHYIQYTVMLKYIFFMKFLVKEWEITPVIWAHLIYIHLNIGLQLKCNETMLYIANSIPLNVH